MKLLTTKEAAKLTGMSKSWFEKMRYLGPGHGPTYIKVGRSIRYRSSDLDDFFSNRAVT